MIGICVLITEENHSGMICRSSGPGKVGTVDKFEIRSAEIQGIRFDNHLLIIALCSDCTVESDILSGSINIDA